MRKPRKNYTPPEKVAILRRHLLDKVPVSDLCDEYQLQPTLFYAWQKRFFENGASAFERKNGSADQALQKTIAALRDKLQRKNEVVAELMEKHIQLKKAWRSPVGARKQEKYTKWAECSLGDSAVGGDFRDPIDQKGTHDGSP